MKIPENHINERLVENAFSKQSIVFDEIYSSNTIINYKRERVRSHILNYLEKKSTILELNCGTGEDAVFFAKLGHHIHATDISKGMHDVLAQKIKNNNLGNYISTELCSYTELKNLSVKGPYDLIFSNFAGLNCTDKLSEALNSVDSLLHPNGVVTLVLLPKFCLWESAMIIKGRFRTATRRWFSRHGSKARVEGIAFSCWYYNPSQIIKALKRNFDLLKIEGLCAIVPPSYLEDFAEKHPRVWKFLKKKEEKYKETWPWKLIGDYYIISFRKKPGFLPNC